jgi:hypothetical protein
MSDKMMGCGHSANATTNGKPCYAICIGLNDAATVVVEAPDLSGRKAICGSCGSIVDSSINLPFFEYRGPKSKTDTDYCICGMHKDAHEYNENRVVKQSVVQQGKCKGFVAAGPKEYDSYYSGCRGWD